MRELRTAFWNYVRNLPSLVLRIAIDVFILAVAVLLPEEASPPASSAEFDVCELSFSNSVTAFSAGNLPYALVPAFLSRAFRHSALFVRADGAIARPEELKGKSVGVQEYDMTAAMVVRGFL